jgi:hypothetical protein
LQAFAFRDLTAMMETLGAAALAELVRSFLLLMLISSISMQQVYCSDYYETTCFYFEIGWICCSFQTVMNIFIRIKVA